MDIQQTAAVDNHVPTDGSPRRRFLDFVRDPSGSRPQDEKYLVFSTDNTGLFRFRISKVWGWEKGNFEGER